MYIYFAIYVAGDFNSRIGKSQDVIAHIDELPPHTVIDEKTNHIF